MPGRLQPPASTSTSPEGGNPHVQDHHRRRSGGRNQRNNPYVLDDLVVSFHRSAAGTAWRWRTELTILTTTLAALWRLALLITLTWAARDPGRRSSWPCWPCPHSRRFITRRFWCVLARHRLQRLCYEARLHTRSGGCR